MLLKRMVRRLLLLSWLWHPSMGAGLMAITESLEEDDDDDAAAEDNDNERRP